MIENELYIMKFKKKKEKDKLFLDFNKQLFIKITMIKSLKIQR